MYKLNTPAPRPLSSGSCSSSEADSPADVVAAATWRRHKEREFLPRTHMYSGKESAVKLGPWMTIRWVTGEQAEADEKEED